MQEIKEGSTVKIEGYTFTVENLCWEGDRARFTGRCTPDPVNDDIRGTFYDGGTYGGRHYRRAD